MAFLSYLALHFSLSFTHNNKQEQAYGDILYSLRKKSEPV